MVATPSDLPMSRTKTIRLLMGPCLISLSFAYFTFLILKDISIPSLIALSILLMGVILTFFDTLSLLQKEALSLSHVLKEKINTIVLDDVLSFIFRVDSDGLIVGAMSAVVGTAGMYALPLNAEQRVRIAQSCWDYTFPPPPSSSSGGDGEDVMDAGVILTKPGGFLSMLPKQWRLALQTTDNENGVKGNDDDESLLLLENDGIKNTPTAVEEKYDHGKNENNEIVAVRDMEWDDEGDTDSTTSTTAANTTTDDSGISNIAPSSHSSYPLAQPSSPTTRTCPQQNLQSAPNIMANGNYNPIANDPCNVMAAIIQEVLLEKMNFILTKSNHRFVNAAGSTAVVALLLHLRYSRAARQAIIRILHGSIALGLVSTAAGCGLVSLVAAGMKPFVVEQQEICTNANNSEQNNGVLTPPTTRDGRGGSAETTTGGVGNILPVSRYGKLFISVLHQIARSERFKSVREILLFVFLYWFHQRRRQKRKAHSGPKRPQYLPNH